MPGAGRLGDKAQVSGPGDAHGCPACPHPAIGPAIIGSPTVNVNRRPALRVDDTGVHAACCGTNMWTAKQGAPTVFINGKAAFRMNDLGQACGGMNKLVEGSSNVIVGDDAGSAGTGGGGRRAAGGGGATAGSGSGGGGGGGGGEAGSSAASGASGGANRNGDAGTSGAGSAAPPATSAPPAAAKTDDEKQIEVQLLNARGEPQRNVRYEITLPDGTVKSGSSGPDGYIRISGLKQSGDAQLVLPELDMVNLATGVPRPK